jgi:predicted dehydrogenase
VAELRVAIIGYGLAGRFFHAPLIAATEGLSVARIVTRDAQRRAQAAAEHPAAQITADVWEDPPPQLVVVATPNGAHAPLAREAITRGVPVLVDKPLALSSEQAAALVADAERAGTLLTVFHNRRWDSDQLTLRKLLEADALGDVTRYESRFERWRPEPEPAQWRDGTSPEAGGGQLLDLGSHLIDQALTLFGPVTHVYAEIARHRATPADDDAFVALSHARGTSTHLYISAFTAAPGPRLRVQGTKAAFVVNSLDPQEAALRAGVRPDAVPRWGEGDPWQRPRLVAGERTVPVPAEPGDWPRFYALLRDAITRGGPPPVDPRDAVRALQVIEAARRSAAQRAIIAL